MLKLFDKEAKQYYGAGCKVGVFLDYVSMPQRSRGSAEDDRTPEEKATFDRALKVRRTPTPLAAHTALCPPPAIPHTPNWCVGRDRGGCWRWSNGAFGSSHSGSSSELSPVSDPSGGISSESESSVG